MSFFGGIADFVKGIGHAISDVAGTVKDRITDPLGLGHLGENIPTSFSVNHNVNVSGKLDVNVNVQGSIDINVNLKDLIVASTVLRDGLVNFDIFGGAIRQLLGNFQQATDIKAFLLELKTILGGNQAARAADYYYVEMTLLNASTEPAIADAPVADLRLFRTPKPCACAVSLILNDVSIADSYELRIPGSSAVIASPLTVEHRFPLQSAPQLNSLRLTASAPFADPDLPSAEALFSMALLQIRLIHVSQNWRYTVVEFIKDGSSKTNTGITLQFINERSRANDAGRSNRSKQLVTKVDDLLSTLTTPNLPTGPFGSASISDLIQKTLIASYQKRVATVVALRDSLRSAEMTAGEFLDARELITVAVSCITGPVGIEMAQTQDGNQMTFVKDVVLSMNDELAVRLPIDVDSAFQRPAGSNIDVTVIVIVPPTTAKGRANIRVYRGFESLTTVVAATTVSGVPGPHQFKVSLKVKNTLQ